jgi:hypothetical protein
LSEVCLLNFLWSLRISFDKLTPSSRLINGKGYCAARFCRMTMKGPEDYRTIRWEWGHSGYLGTC